MSKQEAVLLLEDGTLYKGKSVGKQGYSGGEICFNTGMTGYQEIYTDPSYKGQIIVNTNAHIGNYGTVEAENQGREASIAGVVINEFSALASRTGEVDSLQTFFEKQNVVGIADIDTRALVKHLRKAGAMNAVISSDHTDLNQVAERLSRVPKMENLELSSVVSTQSPYAYGNVDNHRFKVAVLDLGIKKNILDSMVRRGMYCMVYPAKTSFAEMLAFSADGFFISNGPGDPAAMPYAVATVQDILKSGKPLFGICLGHQMLARAIGINTYKMHHGHRGLNHPVKNLVTGLCEITSQNHGFSVDMQGLKNHPDAELTHINLNDDTVEGLRLKSGKAFSVQYHPEASPGPNDAQYLFDDFAALLSK